MRGDERCDDVAQPSVRHAGLDAKLLDSLLAARLADRRVRPFAPEERSRPRGVPRAALVVADAPRAGGEHGRARRVELGLRHEPHELVAHGCRYAAGVVLSIWARWSLPE